MLWVVFLEVLLKAGVFFPGSAAYVFKGYDVGFWADSWWESRGIHVVQGGSLAFLNVQADVTLGLHAVAAGCENFKLWEFCKGSHWGTQGQLYPCGLIYLSASCSMNGVCSFEKVVQFKESRNSFIVKTLWRSWAPGRFLKRWEYQITHSLWETQYVDVEKCNCLKLGKLSTTRLNLVTFSLS